ncbi:MAG: His-Xaa-Ser system radical SAM maturase HxsB [Nannocystaceae bacterium]|nr:His-Xaa-Ser system radical SAM maturase HxsB [Nannocystaceae bacterium]
MNAALRPNIGFPAYFRHRTVGDKVVLTNFEGNHLILTQDEFRDFVEGTVVRDSDLWTRLEQRNFLRETYRVHEAAAALRERKHFLDQGPLLHMLVVTLRCNETCIYCHASRANMDQVQTDMSKETAEKAVDIILASTNSFVTIEFQGGEPLVNFEVVKHVVQYALKKNVDVGKRLEFTMVSNMALMTEEKLDFLLEHKVQMCTSIDGPEKLHNSQRRLNTLDAFQKARYWIQRINERYGEMGLDKTLYHVEALLTLTKTSLAQHKEIIDTYVGLGCKTIFLRPVDPFGFAERTRLKIEYPRSDYLEFYRRAVDYILELNAQGVEILERYASIFLTKILQGTDPNFLDLRSPSGTGLGALAYNYDGSIYTCDEGRMLAAMGDDALKLGHVDDSSYRELMGHETVRAVALASNLDGQPDCEQCAYNPYCGTVPAHNLKTQGSIYGHMPDNNICMVHKGIQDYLFEKLAQDNPDTDKAFERWTTIRPREHFVHEDA